MRKSKGFTLVELVIVMIVLAILTAFAVPRFADLTGEASQAGAEAIGASLSSAGALNFAEHQADSANGISVANCTDVSLLLPGGSLPSGYTIASQTIADDAEVICSLSSDDSSAIVNFLAVGVA